MPVVVNDQTYYRTAEVCRIAGISRSTLFRWLREGIVSDIAFRDWRGWRLFTTDQVEAIRMKTNYVAAMDGRN
ncbi:MAG: MerR family transcriptional regulator [Dehalococcoidia bacterium]